LGIKSDADVISNGTIYTAKGDDTMIVTLPLHDRNGDVAAAVRVKMKTFKGQTDENAIVRAMPIVKDMEDRMPAVDDLAQ
jgi:hypothetical protein